MPATVKAPAIMRDFFIALRLPVSPSHNGRGRSCWPPLVFLRRLLARRFPEPSRQGASSARQSSVFQPTVIFAPGSNCAAPSEFGSLTTKSSWPQTETRVRT